MGIAEILALPVKGLIEAGGAVIDKLSTTDDERNRAKIELQKLILEDRAQTEQTIRRELEAKERVLVAELSQDDAYTKRARPTIIYTGLVIALTSAAFKLLGSAVDVNLLVPAEFWYAWGGISATWVIGRTAEKRGTASPLVEKITGKRSILD